MLVTTVQAAHATKLTKYQIDKLVKAGVLQDHGVRKPGASRHVHLVDLQEAKAYVRGVSNGNGHRQEAAQQAIPVSVFTPTPAPTSEPPIGARLLRLEAKLDAVMQQLKALLDAWA